jgi:CheY-like chemotaxis protein
MPTILIVDDDQKLLKMLQRTLVYENLSVVTATNGQEALAVLHNQRAEGNGTVVLMLTARDAGISQPGGVVENWLREHWQEKWCRFAQFSRKLSARCIRSMRNGKSRWMLAKVRSYAEIETHKAGNDHSAG